MSGNIRGPDRAFTAWIAGLTLTVMLIGFSRSFFLLPFFDDFPAWAAKEAIFLAHGAVFAAWFGLLAVQVILIRRGSARLHRQLGYAGAGLGAVVFVVGVVAALRAAKERHAF